MRPRTFIALIIGALVLLAAPAFATVQSSHAAPAPKTPAPARRAPAKAAVRKPKHATKRAAHRAPVAAPRATLTRCAALTRGQQLVSHNRQYRFAMQADGNAVLYHGRTPLWTSDTAHRAVRGITLQCDQNLVLNATNKQPLWSSGTRGEGGSHLVMQDDGNAVLYTAANRPTWNTDTAGGHPAAPPAPPVNPRTEAAIAWYLSRMGSSAWEGRCELTAELAYGTSGRYPTARANWMSGATAQHPGVEGAPRGALVFWSTSAAGHVALSLGDGTVLSSSAGGHIGRVPVTYFQNPLGWKQVPF
jgi:hypothetical protein